MARATCYYCDLQADHQCPTCGRLYCADHGDDVCLRCMAPESATPSAWAYRGSLAALVAGAAVAIFLVVSPPASEGAGDVIRTSPTTAPTALPTVAPTPRPTAPAGATATRPTTVSASPTAGASPPPSPSPAARTYTVREGDTLFAIAARFNTSVEAILAVNPGLDPEFLSLGQVLTIPGPP